MLGKKTISVSIIVLSIAVYFTYIRQPVKDVGKVVTTKTGKVQGVISKSRDGREFYEWLGIPYAKPPVRDRRYASPEPVEPWEGIHDSSKYGSKCTQMEMLTWRISGEEDCLYLNVFVPKVDHNGLLPVMIHIHGGGFVFMSPEEYRPEYFMDEDIIFVSMNYRMGTFGFLSTADTIIRGNMGLKDQALALKWVKENIKSFGGDPDHMTIFGESAGGASVHHMMLSPTTRGLFHRAISQSGVANIPLLIEPATEAKAHTLKFAKSVGCNSTDSKGILLCLRDRSVPELMEASKADFEAMRPQSEGHLFKPVIEAVNDNEAFLTEHPLDIVATGRAMRIPWMTGVVSHEGLLGSLEFYRIEESMAEFESKWQSNVLRAFGVPRTHPEGSLIAKKIYDIYFSNSSLQGRARAKRYTDMFSDAFFNLPMSHTMSIQRKYSPVYLYYYTRKGPSLVPLLTELGETFPILIELAIAMVKQYCKRYVFGQEPDDVGVAHADDLPMLFLRPSLFHIPRSDDDQDYKFSKDLVKLYVDFAKDDTSMEFRGTKLNKASTDEDLKYMEINESPRIISEPFKDRTDILKTLNILEHWVLKGMGRESR